ncbi:hypothetical protein GCM10009665_37760 [Kitasatospora nipponensis]|uniref:Uncharacterized protein n=1 Tax=Kitasatospora nipponensis TaxID=258049 RepID=A0ABP4H0K5_9ACTN
MSHERYELTFRHTPAFGRPGNPDVVVVQRQEATGPGGHPLYRDRSGILCVEISDRDEVRMLSTGVHQSPLRPTAVRRS